MNGNQMTVKLFWWPALFAGLTLLTQDGGLSALVVLAMAFHSDISTVLRRRRVSIQGGGLQCTLDTLPKQPEESQG